MPIAMIRWIFTGTFFCIGLWSVGCIPAPVGPESDVESSTSAASNGATSATTSSATAQKSDQNLSVVPKVTGVTTSLKLKSSVEATLAELKLYGINQEFAPDSGTFYDQALRIKAEEDASWSESLNIPIETATKIQIECVDKVCEGRTYLMKLQIGSQILQSLAAPDSSDSSATISAATATAVSLLVSPNGSLTVSPEIYRSYQTIADSLDQELSDVLSNIKVAAEPADVLNLSLNYVIRQLATSSTLQSDVFAKVEFAAKALADSISAAQKESGASTSTVSPQDLISVNFGDAVQVWTAAVSSSQSAIAAAASRTFNTDVTDWWSSSPVAAIPSTSSTDDVYATISIDSDSPTGSATSEPTGPREVSEVSISIDLEPDGGGGGSSNSCSYRVSSAFACTASESSFSCWDGIMQINMCIGSTCDRPSCQSLGWTDRGLLSCAF
jgi:hypothetical protein